MGQETFALTEYTYQVPVAPDQVDLATVMVASVEPTTLEYLALDAMSSGYLADIHAIRLRHYYESQRKILDDLHKINDATRETYSDSVYKSQRIVHMCHVANLTTPAKLLDHIFDGLAKLEKPVIDDHLIGKIQTANLTAERAKQRLLKAERAKSALEEQTLLAEQIELTQKRLGLAVRIGTAMTAAAIFGGSALGILSHTAQIAEKQDVKAEIKTLLDAENVLSETRDNYASIYGGIGVFSIVTAYAAGYVGYNSTHQPAARFAQYRARRIVKKAK